jgi:hypothetical protein
MRAMADATIAAIPDRSVAAVGRLTGLAYALTHEELRAKVTEITARSYAIGEQWLLFRVAFATLAKNPHKK